MGHENILVIGNPRHSHRYIEVVIARKYAENFRIQKVYKPKILERMKNSKWDWRGNSDEAHDEIVDILKWLNPEK